ncbi:Eco57I restriction-modification methylase domain-containing protein [Roseateles puraquae]|jgi:hypothetical protein|uniref:Eco57I restriction-modification methylase domain-containing protein n=1 Tax=Roseateles puraquae TaxID=431059 RepID=UPI0031E422C6
MSMHHEWLSLIEISGPFLAIPVLKEVFPQGLEELDAAKRKRLRQAHDEWHEAQETGDPRFADLHTAWIDEVLSRGLELDEDGRGDVLKGKDWCAAHSNVSLPEHGVSLSPDFAVVGNDDKPLMLVHVCGADVDLDATSKQDGWASTPAERMVTLCRATGCRLGLVTNGERWMLVDAPVGAVTTFASWYARIWGQEPVTLQAFVHLLGIRRFFVDEPERLPALFDRSLKFQDEVTDALGEQVRRAVEVLIQALDQADQDRSRELLRGVKEAELYEAALTVMMRLVFLLSAEERGLLLLGDERYEANYALATLRMQLRAESDEILERRWDAWSRLLAVFRAVYGGIEHENLRLPALGGSLFDPDRFPFLEGRAKGSDWRIDIAKPLPIDNRTVLLLLEAIQQFQGRTLSYRALDVEQIGYVYEGLLERTVKRTAEITLELDATKSAQSPWVTLAELESARLDGAERLAELLQQRSGSSANRVRNDLARPVDDALADRMLTACHGDTALRDRVKPFGHLVRTDPWGYPLVFPAGAFVVTTGSDRRETGTHYTPKSLTEAIVTEALTPIAYVGPSQGTPRAEWALKSPAELLDLKICDPAMGSGAFLVQACRWLADRLVEAWAQVEAQGHAVGVDGRVVDADANVEALPRETEARTIVARRLIAERCLYGVDLNPLAVELAKLSIWLVTLAKGRPFGFLDHNLRCGDSLLGIHRLDQLTQLSMNAASEGQLRLFGQNIRRAVLEAIELRQRLREMPIRDICDVEAMAHLDAGARRKLEVPECIADAFIGEVFALGGNSAGLEDKLVSLTVQAGQAIEGDQGAFASMRRRSVATLSTDLPVDKFVRRPFHWPLEFPEVFGFGRGGFDAFIGNPPYRGGSRITIDSGVAYRDYLVSHLTNGFVGRVDLCVYFLRQCTRLLSDGGAVGLVLTNSVAQGHNRDAGLAHVLRSHFSLHRSVRDLPWPGSANVLVSLIWLFRGNWSGETILNGCNVRRINSNLMEGADSNWEARTLLANAKLCFRGIEIRGDGFILGADEAELIVKQEPCSREIIRPFLTGTELNSRWPKSQDTYVIAFGDRSASESAKYSKCWDIVVNKVKPERDKITKQIHEECFWKFWDKRTKNFDEVTGHQEYLVKARDSTEWAFAYVSKDYVVSSKIIVFKNDSLEFFGILQSCAHRVWCENGASTIGRAITYNPTLGLERFPFPEQASVIGVAAQSYLLARSKAMSALGVGMNALYRLTHLKAEQSNEVANFRQEIQRLDSTILAVYGWGDLDLEHGFHEVPYLPEGERIRFTISEVARVDLLYRLSELNRQRHEKEASQAGRADPIVRTPTHLRHVSRVPGGASTPQSSLDFGTEKSIATHGTSPGAAIVAFLSAYSGWCAKADVLSATGITDGQWSAAIAELVSSGRVERQGEKRGARYRIQPEQRYGHREGAP